MRLKLACGHEQTVKPRENWLRVIRLGCMRCRMEAKTIREVLLVGGPQDGRRARVGGARPVILFEVSEEPPSLLDSPGPVVRWNEQTEWYEA